MIVSLNCQHEHLRLVVKRDKWNDFTYESKHEIIGPCPIVQIVWHDKRNAFGNAKKVDGCESIWELKECYALQINEISVQKTLETNKFWREVERFKGNVPNIVITSPGILNRHGHSNFSTKIYSLKIIPLIKLYFSKLSHLELLLRS